MYDKIHYKLKKKKKKQKTNKQKNMDIVCFPMILESWSQIYLWNFSTLSFLKATAPRSPMVLCISVVSAIISNFSISNFIDLGPLPFYLDESQSLEFYQFYIFKERVFSFIELFYCFPSLYSIYFCSDLYDFFLAINFGFGLLFFL